MKSPREIARYTFEKLHSAPTKACEGDILSMIESAIETDRAQRRQMVTFNRDELQMIRNAFGTIEGGWNLTNAEQNLVKKIERRLEK